MEHKFSVEEAFCYYDKIWGWQAVERDKYGNAVGSSGVYSSKNFAEKIKADLENTYVEYENK